MQKVSQVLGDLVEAFLLSKRVAGCTQETLNTYHLWLILRHCALYALGDEGKAVVVARPTPRHRAGHDEDRTTHGVSTAPPLGMVKDSLPADKGTDGGQKGAYLLGARLARCESSIVDRQTAS